MTLRDLAQTLGEARAAVQDSDNGVPPDGLPKAEISSVGRGGNLEIQ